MAKSNDICSGSCKSRIQGSLKHFLTGIMGHCCREDGFLASCCFPSCGALATSGPSYLLRTFAFIKVTARACTYHGLANYAGGMTFALSRHHHMNGLSYQYGFVSIALSLEDLIAGHYYFAGLVAARGVDHATLQLSVSRMKQSLSNSNPVQQISR